MFNQATTPPDLLRRLQDQTREQIQDLEAAGWKRKTDVIWKDPHGCLFAGPNGAWRVMRARKERK
jgi:hypothetical protein